MQRMLNTVKMLSVRDDCTPDHMVKAALVLRYGVPKEHLQLQAIRSFLHCAIRNDETVDLFLERFKKLQVKSGVVDPCVVCIVLFDSFPNSFKDVVTVAMSQVSAKKFFDPEYLINVVRRISHSVDAKDGMLVPDGLKNRKRGLEGDSRSSPNDLHKESKKSKWAPGNGGGSSGAVGLPRGAGDKPTGKRCWRCGANNWSRDHVCGTGVKSKNPAKVLRVLSKSSAASSVDNAVNLAVLSAAAGARPVSSSGDDVSSSDGVSSSGDVDSSAGFEPMEDVDEGLGDLEGKATTLVKTMARVSVSDDDVEAVMAMNAQDCKFDVKFNAAPAMKTNCICVPIVVQNVSCFGLVDSGATFSCITNELFMFLSGQSFASFKPSNDVVQLGHVSSTVSRLGQLI
ncbi:hypothetical protein [Parasitella parasitica]|uniref:Uncharacterized protein n=1 Tax=Parasitella parasitica TaxID=35722 RepID=A0A0B7N406_9FUNG|nr:hypothetical protein [Parasitella parasitica]